MNLPKQHFIKTKKLLQKVEKVKIANWLLNEGYFPEQYVLPPTFRIINWGLQDQEYYKKIDDLPRRNLEEISYPKSQLTSRIFAIQHPWNYHDIVFWLMSEWDSVVEHLFHEENNVFSYSFPIPISSRHKGDLSSLRSGRMIYEWIEMAERDMVAEADKYTLIIRTDITNYYNSIYTHSIAWALHGREDALKDKDYKLYGSKIDRLIQYANDGRTNGIPVGSALTDLIAEIILTKIDRNISGDLKDIDFVATRFKDDYRFLCNSDGDANKILRVITDRLAEYNLLINESKTQKLNLPHGLYRQHDREYAPYSLKQKEYIPFKLFENTLLKAIDLHRAYPGTSLLEKFFSELFDKQKRLKIIFSSQGTVRKKEIFKTCSLLILTKRESEKVLCWSLAIIEDIYAKYGRDDDLKSYLKELIEKEMEKASDRKSAFELTWLLFFSRYVGLGITNINNIICEDTRENSFLKSVVNSRQKLFNDSGVNLFRKPKDCRNVKLAERLDIFNKNLDVKR